MKLVAALVITAATRPAAACGVPDIGAMLGDVAKAFETKRTPVHTPLVIVGGGAATDGRMASIHTGYGWGHHEDSWLFPGTTISRVLLGIRSDAADTTHVSATYGWYSNQIGSLGLDLGAEVQMSGTRALGPTARLTVGHRGVAVRLTGGAMFGDVSRFTGAAELVVEVMDLGRSL